LDLSLNFSFILVMHHREVFRISNEGERCQLLSRLYRRLYSKTALLRISDEGERSQLLSRLYRRLYSKIAL